MLDGARIFHVNVNCSDLAASRAFYVEHVRADRGRAHHARRRAVGHRVRARPGAVGRVDPRRRRRLRRRRGRPPRVAGAAPDRSGARVRTSRASPASGRGRRPASRRRRGRGSGRRRGRARAPGRRRASSPSRSTCADRDRSLAFYRALGFTDAAADADSEPDEVVLAAPGGGPVRLVLARADRDRDRRRGASGEHRRDLAHRPPGRRPRRDGGPAAGGGDRVAVRPAGDDDGPGGPRPALRLLPRSRPRGHRAHRVPITDPRRP